MTNAILEKARAILAHSKQGDPPKADAIKTCESTAHPAEPTVPAAISKGAIGTQTTSIPSALPNGYCRECGGGRWIRETHESGWQCEQCHPVEPHVDFIYVPGGTHPPAVHSQSGHFVAEPACKPDNTPLSPIYWETGTGRILGPAVPEFFARDGGSYWISTTFEGKIRWINADRLRSRKAFEQQPDTFEFEPIV